MTCILGDDVSGDYISVKLATTGYKGIQWAVSSDVTSNRLVNFLFVTALSVRLGRSKLTVMSDQIPKYSRR
jgi:uncharacterized membrane protein